MKTRHAGLLLIATLAIAGCETMAPASPPPVGGLSELMERPAERALFEGMRAYDDGQYVASEAALKRALNGGLASPRDRATAHKLIAFIACTSQRMAECEMAFRAARTADPAFVLSRSEAGHPMWGPVFRKLAP